MQEDRPPTRQDNLLHTHYTDYSVVLSPWVCVLYWAVQGNRYLHGLFIRTSEGHCPAPRAALTSSISTQIYKDREGENCK